MHGAVRTYLVSSQRNRVNVTLFSRVAVLEMKLRWIEQLGSHVADNPRLGCRCASRLHNTGIGYDSGDPEVPQTRRTILVDQDISLGRKYVST